VTVENRWDWVPGWVAESPEDISHGLCDACAAYYYPADREVDSFPETIHTTSSVEPASFRQPSPSGGGEERAGR
jgi:hypothetical protein